ncbi:MAG: phosphomannomutase/phosphoglucomutase [Burkholderiaceae bacterium]|nr:phosphomannomutase/phosphoglucomutase [Burkholderiaceae bacterium]
MQPAASIFKAYDIRGVVDDTLTEPVVRAIGMALGLLVARAGPSACVVGRDGRLSGPRLVDALADGLMASGIDVLDVGQVPTPVVYFGTVASGCGSGVAVTGSHNPPQYNGLKMMVGGVTLWGDAIGRIRELILSGEAQRHVDALDATRRGKRIPSPKIASDYANAIVQDVRLARPMTIAVDAGNGVAGGMAPELLARIGCHVKPLFCEVDGNFPNHHPDPAHVENLQDLIDCVRTTDAEIGLAFDGDGDRLGVVTKSGAIIWPDRQLMLYAADVLAVRPGGQIIFDVKCTRHVASWVRQHGGVPLMWKTGHSLIKAKLKETGAPLAGEMSGHIFFNDRWYGFDDALYTAARLLEIVSRVDDPSALLESLPDSASTPELQLATQEGENFSIVERLRQEGHFPSATECITIDGIRVEYADGFGLARPSNTTPVIVMRFEADNPVALARIQSEFRDNFSRLLPDVRLPF